MCQTVHRQPVESGVNRTTERHTQQGRNISVWLDLAIQPFKMYLLKVIKSVGTEEPDLTEQLRKLETYTRTQYDIYNHKVLKRFILII